MGKKIGKSVLGKGKPLKPTKSELEEMEELQKELAEEKKAERLEREENKGKLSRLAVPGETTPEEKRPLFGTRILPPLEDAEIEVSEVPDKRLKVGKKTRVDIRRIKE